MRKFITLGMSLILGASSAAAAELKAGDPAPAFEAKADDGKTWSLDSLKGKIAVLYFYPKDDTPGCTAQAKGFRDDYEKFEALGAVVLGASLDSEESHQAFRAKYDLNFPLLVNAREVAKAFGVPSRLGFASRQTFVIGKDGTLLHVMRKVSPKGHSEELLKLIKEAQND